MLGRTLFALSLTVILAVLLLGVGGWLSIRRSLPPEFEFHRAAVRDTVTVWRDSFAIPTILASNSLDAFFALGYLHAQDRLWQMDLARRIAAGRVAEILGKEALPLDLLMRALDLQSMARRLWDSLHPLSRRILQRYAEGVNFWLRHHRGNLPPEFLLLGYTPEDWDELHSLSIARLMAFDLAFCFWSDIAMGALAEELGERARELLPGYPPSAPTVVDELFSVPSPIPPDTGLISKELNVPPIPPGFRAWALAAISPLRSFLGRTSGQGSNAWAVRTATGAVLANDPHLLLGLPARWYPVSIVSPEYEVAGLTLPGLPLAIIGRNRFVAWGVTNLMADESDFFIERIDSLNPLRYWDGVQWRRFQRWRDTIRIRGSPSVVVEFLRSRNGPVISAYHLFAAPRFLFRHSVVDTAAHPFLRRYRLSYRWAAAERCSDEVLAAYRFGRARSWEQFHQALQTWGAPTLCFVYADYRGTVAVQAAGYLPRRDTTLPESVWAFPLPGWEPRYQWAGVLSAGELPRLLNPRHGFVVSANQKFSRNLTLPLSYIWEPPSRAERLTELLLQRGLSYTLSDAERMQSDVLSPYARRMMSVLMPLLDRFPHRSPSEQRALQHLRNWNAVFDRQSVGATLYSVLLQRLLANSFGVHLSERALREYLFLSNLALRRLAELVHEPNSPWFDNPRTPERESLTEVLHRSLREALDTLRQRFGEAPEQWHYARLHTLRLEHPLGLHPLLRPLFCRGPYPSAGAPTTVNTGEWHLWRPFEQALGASARFAADVGDTKWSVVLPGGISGNFLSPHYGDQVPLWLYGGAIRRSMGIPPTGRRSLVFAPGAVH